jgi:hypothetical protein
MWVQRIDQIPVNNNDSIPEHEKASRAEIRGISSDRIGVYKTFVKGKPNIRPRISIKSTFGRRQRRRALLHSFTRLNGNLTVEPDQQIIGSFTGFQAKLKHSEIKSKAYYYLTLPKPPDKSTLIEVMLRVERVREMKRMPFVVLVGDQPVYALITQIKNENRETFEKLVPFLGPFHTPATFMACIYKSRVTRGRQV